MIVDNGAQVRLLVPGVFDGVAGLARGRLWFAPVAARLDPAQARHAVLNDQVITISPVKDDAGPGWSTRYESAE